VITAKLNLEQTGSPAKKHVLRKSSRRKLTRVGLYGFNLALLAAIVVFVWSYSSWTSSDAASATTIQSAAEAQLLTKPLDEVSASDIAVNIARAADLPEATAVTNQSDSANAHLAVIKFAPSLVAKPQIVATDYFSNKDIKTYTVQKGDTVDRLAKKFDLHASTIRWSNDLAASANQLKAGKTLYISPLDGIVYVFKKGDTAAKLANKYDASQAKIVAYNDAELKGLKKGERIIIPGGQLPRPTPSPSPSFGGFSRKSGGTASFPWGGHAIYGGNGYDYGYCTWYVATQLPVPSNWGNANTWDNLAPRSGWSVSTKPSVGSIAQTDYAAGGLGHVAIVRAVSADGSRVKIADMNGLAGWGNVGVGWEPTSEYQHYISH
jgi:LysM repeat protein